MNKRIILVIILIILVIGGFLFIDRKNKIESTSFQDAMQKAQASFNDKEYDRTVDYFEEALTFEQSDKVYAGLYLAYTAKQDWEKARDALDNAIDRSTTAVEYRKWKLSLLDEKTDASFADLKKYYEDSLAVLPQGLSIDLVTHFARIAESNNEKIEAVTLWERAKLIFPDNSKIYQAEIDRLKASQ